MLFFRAYITEARTAACSAIATDLLSSKDSSILAIIGTGVQARSHIRFCSLVRNFKEIRIWGRTVEKAQLLADEMKIEYPGVNVLADETVEAAVAEADVICTVTSSMVVSKNTTRKHSADLFQQI
jgi:ornithine cyclodeaminase